MAPLDALRRATTIAASQHAAIAHHQARSAGLSDKQIRGLVDRGTWRRRVRGVFVVAGSPDTAKQRLTVAYLAVQRAGGMISHLSAAAEFDLVRHPLLPHVTVPPKASAGTGTARIHRGIVPLVDRVYRGPLLVTSVSRTIVDCASLLDRSSLEQLVDVAFCRKLAAPRSVRDAADRIGRGRVGIQLIQEVIEAWSTVIEPGSPPEMRALRLLAELGMDGLVSQHSVYDERGRFVARLDLADPATRRGFEYDGVETHNPRRWAHDEARYAELRRLGWAIESLSKLDLLPGERRLRDIVARWGPAQRQPDRECEAPLRV